MSRVGMAFESTVVFHPLLEGHNLEDKVSQRLRLRKGDCHDVCHHGGERWGRHLVLFCVLFCVCCFSVFFEEYCLQ